MSRNYVDLITPLIPGIAGLDLSQPFDALGIDSFDLLNIRVLLERQLNAEIPDRDWVSFKTLDQLFAYCDAGIGGTGRAGARETHDTGHQLRDGRSGGASVSSEAGYSREFELNMPQMALSSLSEGWLFKELGAAHWELLCHGLGQRSSELKDELGNRLYATFARVQHAGTHRLSDYQESETLRLSGQLHRYGGGMYYSQFSLASLTVPDRIVNARLITSFARRGERGDNKDLVKSQPMVPDNPIPNLAAAPDFIDEYRLIKKQERREFLLSGNVMTISDEVVHQAPYEISPYHDLNGVGLLYFAAYPVITDICEARYFNKDIEGGSPRWEEQWSTTARDVMYYGNCDISETVIYTLHAVEKRGSSLYTQASLRRSSDDALMARISTIKAKRLPG